MSRQRSVNRQILVLAAILSRAAGCVTQPADPLISRRRAYERLLSFIEPASLAARGAPIGSGAMESACRQFQNRLQRRGQFWSRRGLRHLLAVDVAIKNGSLAHLWN